MKQGRLFRDERLKLIRELREKIANIQTPDVSWDREEGKNDED